jgi:hypothetical protein
VKSSCWPSRKKKRITAVRGCRPAARCPNPIHKQQYNRRQSDREPRTSNTRGYRKGHPPYLRTSFFKTPRWTQTHASFYFFYILSPNPTRYSNRRSGRHTTVFRGRITCQDPSTSLSLGVPISQPRIYQLKRPGSSLIYNKPSPRPCFVRLVGISRLFLTLPLPNLKTQEEQSILDIYKCSTSFNPWTIVPRVLFFLYTSQMTNIIFLDAHVNWLQLKTCK